MNKSKYQIIADDIRSKIITKEFLVGSVIPPEVQLQEDYQVSRHTVRQAISVLVNEGYLRKEKGSGTYVENALQDNYKKLPNSNVIGVITTYLSDYIFPSIIRGIEKELRDNGYSLLLASTNNDISQERRCLEQMLEQQVAGLIVEPTKSNQYNSNLDYYLAIKEQNVPIVMINTAYEELSLPVVCVDDVKGGLVATNHLIEQGHENLALITKIDDLQGKYRMKGFIKAHENAKIKFHSENIFTYSTETVEDVLKELLLFLEKNREITGIVCYNDEVAYKLIQNLIENNFRIPDDFSIVGNDDSVISTAKEIQLTTLSHPKEQLGVMAAKSIISALHGKDIQDQVFEPMLVVRDSVRKI